VRHIKTEDFHNKHRYFSPFANPSLRLKV